MGRLGNGSHRGQGRQASTVLGLPPWYFRFVLDTIAGRYLSSWCYVMMFNADLMYSVRTCDDKRMDSFQTSIVDTLRNKVDEGEVGCASLSDGSWGCRCSTDLCNGCKGKAIDCNDSGESQNDSDKSQNDTGTNDTGKSQNNSGIPCMTSSSLAVLIIAAAMTSLLVYWCHTSRHRLSVPSCLSCSSSASSNYHFANYKCF